MGTLMKISDFLGVSFGVVNNIYEGSVSVVMIYCIQVMCRRNRIKSLM